MENTFNSSSGKSCNSCGAMNAGHATFCSSCGKRVNGNSVSHNFRTITKQWQKVSSQMTIPLAWALFIAAYILLSLFLRFDWWTTAFCFYLIAGFVLTKYVMGNLITWHPVNATIDNIFSTKIGMFILWPLRLPILLFKLTIIRLL